MIDYRVSFQNQQGDELAGRLSLPAGEQPRAYALFAHCFTCGKDLRSLKDISRQLTLQGFGVLRFDFTGLGESEGDFAGTNFAANVQDLIDAAHYLQEYDQAPQLLLGHSLGGPAVLCAAHYLDRVQAVATIGAPADPEHVQHLLQNRAPKPDGSTAIKIGGRSFQVSESFMNDLQEQKMTEILQGLKRAYLILHSPQDEVVGIANAGLLYERALHPKSFVTLDGANHLMSNRADANYAGQMIAAWASRYISFRQPEQLETQHQVVARTGGSLTTELRAGQHGFMADEPQSAGGNDLGPNPYDLLGAALGSCTGMTLRLYANHKQWDLQEVQVHLTHGKVHATDCETCETQDGKVDRIYRDIHLKGNLDAKQRARLLEIANRCPVHRSLHSEFEVITRELTPAEETENGAAS